MIRVQEVGDNRFHGFNELPKELQDELRQQTCLNCENQFPKDGNIHYLVTKKTILWWHDWHCVSQNKKFAINN
jgi:hypothetical protein